MNQQQTINIGAEGTEYGNWMSAPVMKMAYGLVAILAVVDVLIIFLWKNLIGIGVATVLLVVVLYFALYLQKVRNTFSFKKGRLMDRIIQNLVEHLSWDGNGTILDVGCGSGAVSIRVAKTFQTAKVVGIDYWGPMWDYSDNMCSKNAALEKVADRCTFQHGDATALEFEEETFDAVVSNFVYHEVMGVSDKKTLLLESLRVLKKGGSFALQDYFDRSDMFGTPDEVMNYLKEHGISEVYYEGNVDGKEWMPKYVLKSFIIKDIGVVYGKK